MKYVPTNHRLPATVCLSLMSLLLLTACAPQVSTPSETAQDPRAFVESEPSVPEIIDALESGQITSEAMVTEYLSRIDRYDDSGPKLNAIIKVNDAALEQARAADQQRAKGEKGALLGVPIILKDNINTEDLQTTAGSVLFENRLPEQNAFIAEQLKEAGAITLAKANLDEFAYGQTTLSSMGGQTLNPYDTTRNPSGSSGGSSVAVAAGFAPLAIGSDTGGSLRLPPATVSAVGIRPTTGLIGRSGIAPISTSMDTVGPISTSVESVAAALDVVAGDKDPDDSLSEEGNRPISYVDALDPDALAGARIGILRGLYGTTPEAEPVNEVMSEVEKRLVDAGAELVVIDNLGIQSTEGNRITYEMSEGIETWLQAYGTNRPADSLEEIVASGTVVPSVSTILKGIIDSPENVLGTEDPAYEENVVRPAAAYADQLASYLDDNNLDAFFYPTVKEPPALAGVSNWEASNSFMSSLSGHPSITFPVGLDRNGLPVGGEFMGAKFDESAILSLAYSYEQQYEGRVKPPLSE